MSDQYAVTGEMIVCGKRWERRADTALSEWRREDGYVATREHHETLNALLEDRERLAALEEVVIETSGYLDRNPRVPREGLAILRKLLALQTK